MLKTIVMIKKRPDLSYDAFADYWLNRHSKIVAQLPGLRRMVMNRIEHDAMRTEPAYDGVTECWWDDLDSLRAMMESEVFHQMRADEPNFIVTEDTRALVVQEVPVID